MPILKGKTTVAIGATSPWVNTGGDRNIQVGVDGTAYTIEYNLGSDIVYAFAAATAKGVQEIPSAHAVRVTAGVAACDFEVFN